MATVRSRCRDFDGAVPAPLIYENLDSLFTTIAPAKRRTRFRRSDPPAGSLWYELQRAGRYTLILRGTVRTPSRRTFDILLRVRVSYSLPSFLASR